MIKARNKRISLLLAIVFVLTLVLPMGSAFAADPAKITSTVVKNLEKDDDILQDAGFVKITDMDDAERIYVEVELPDGVDFTVHSWVYTGDETGEVSSDEDSLTFWVDYDTIIDDADYIKVNFNDLIISGKAKNDIVVSVTVRGVESGQQIYEISKDCTIGQIGDAEITVTADSPKSISAGSGKSIAKITIKEDSAGAIKDGNKLVITLPDDFKWNSSIAVNSTYVTQGKYGLRVEGLAISDEDLTVTFGDSNSGTSGGSLSTTFADKVELKLAVDLYPDAPDGDLEVTVSAGNPFNPDFDDVELVVAKVGGTEGDVTVEDTSDDTIYPGQYDMVIDDMTIEASANFGDGDKVSLTLPEGFVWDVDVDGYSADGVFDVLGTYNDGRSLWIELDPDYDEVTFEDLEILALPDAPLGKIEVKVTGDFEGSAVVGECIAPVAVTAEKKAVALAALGQAAGDITIEETKKGALRDGQLILSLPKGVEFSGKPTVEVNGKEVASGNLSLNSDGDELTIGSSSDITFSSTKLDKIVISDIEYDIDSRLRTTDVKVEISGDAINFLGDSAADDNYADAGDYADDAVATVVNASAASDKEITKSFKVGDPGVAVKNGRTLVQVNTLCDVLGLTKSWDAASKTAYFVKDGKVVAFPMGKNQVLINGNPIPVDQGGVIIDGATYATLRGLEMAFGGKLSWDAATKTATFKF